MTRSFHTTLPISGVEANVIADVSIGTLETQPIGKTSASLPRLSHYDFSEFVVVPTWIVAAECVQRGRPRAFALGRVFTAAAERVGGPSSRQCRRSSRARLAVP